MKKFFRSLLGKSAFALALATLTAGAAEPKKLLVVTTTTGFRHSSIATAVKVLTQLAEQSKAFTLDFAQQPPNKPNPPKKPANASDADLEKFKADEEKFKTADAEWQETLKKNLSKLSAENLKNYDGVIFANTTGDLPIPDPQAFVDSIAQGHAFIGMHSASDTYHEGLRIRD